MPKRFLKFALLAASALAAAAPVVAHAAPPTESTPAISHAVAQADEAPTAANPAHLAGFAALAAAFAAFLGRRRLFSWLKRTAPAVQSAALAVVEAPAAAARTVGRALAAPFRSLVLFAGAGLFALAGVGLYDVEWAGGLAAGLLLAALVFGGVRKLKTVPIKSKAQRSEKFNQ